MQVGVTPEETAVLIRWKKRSDNHALVRMKTEAILYASRGVDVGIIAEMVERAERTVQEWLADWQATRMCSVLTGHAGNRDAAEPARAQKEELRAVLARPPSRSGVHAGFWDVPAIREVVKILFDAEYRSDSSYRLLLRPCGPNLGPPGPVRRAPQRAGHHQTRGRGDDPGQNPVGPGPEGLHGRRGPPRARGRDPPHAAPERTTHQTVRGPEEDVPVLPRRPPRPAEQSRRTRPSRTGTPSRRPSHRTCSNKKPAPARPRSSRTTHDSTTRKH